MRCGLFLAAGGTGVPLRHRVSQTGHVFI